MRPVDAAVRLALAACACFAPLQPSCAQTAYVSDEQAFAVSPDGKWLYVANEDDALVSFVDIAARKIVREVPVGAEVRAIIHTGGKPWGVVVLP